MRGERCPSHQLSQATPKQSVLTLDKVIIPNTTLSPTVHRVDIPQVTVAGDRQKHG
jgi:hypothetical protein